MSIAAAFEKLTSIKPLSDDASPEQIQAFRARAQKYLTLSQEAVTHLNGVMTASGLDPDEPQEPKLNGNLVKAIKCFQELEAVVDSGPLTPQDYALRLHETGKGSKQADEQAAFAALLRGYTPAPTVEDWYDILQAKPQDLDYYSQSVRTEATDDITQRLLEREKALSMIQAGTTLRGLANSVMLCIHAVRFAHEWKQLTTARGGKKKKTEYRKAAFEARYPHTPRADYEADLKAFTNRHLVGRRTQWSQANVMEVATVGHAGGADGCAHYNPASALRIHRIRPHKDCVLPPLPPRCWTLSTSPCSLLSCGGLSGSSWEYDRRR